MSKGLDQILTRVAEEPNNLVLRDRYLMLVSEMPDTQAKAERILELARIVKDNEPEQALRLAYLVYQYDRLYLPALDFIAELFSLMSRPGKAEILRNHISNLDCDKDQTFQPLNTTFPKDLREEANSKFDVEQSIVASLTGNAAKLEPVTVNFSNEIPSFAKFSSDKKSRSLSQLGNFRLGSSVVEDSQKMPSVSKPSTRAAKLDSESARTFVFDDLMTKSEERAADNEGEQDCDVGEIEAFVFDLDEAAEPADQQVMSSEPSPVSENRHKIPEELFDYYWRQGFVEKAENILIQTERFASHLNWWQERMLRIKTQDGNFAVPDLSDLHGEFSNWNVKLRSMLAQHRYRAALFVIYTEVMRSTDEGWVSLACEYLPEIWQQLGLRGEELSSKTTLRQLQKVLEKRSMPTLSVIACGERF